MIKQGRYKDKLKRKTPRKTLIKKLQNQAEKLWKEYCHQRDGEGCQVQIYFPNIETKHTQVYQVDHCFSRMNKELFLDVQNGTVVCSACNQRKAFHYKPIELAIDDIVMNREGIDAFNRMREVASRKGGFKDWTNIAWLEMQIKILTDMSRL